MMHSLGNTSWVEGRTMNTICLFVGEILIIKPCNFYLVDLPMNIVVSM